MNLVECVGGDDLLAVGTDGRDIETREHAAEYETPRALAPPRADADEGCCTRVRRARSYGSWVAAAITGRDRHGWVLPWG